MTREELITQIKKKKSFLCVGLRQKQYCFENEQLTKEEYEKKTMALARGLDLDRLISMVLKNFKIERDILMSSSRQRSVARSRAIICCLAVDRLKITGVAVAGKLKLTPSAVSKLAARGRLDAFTKQIGDDILGFQQG